MQEEISMALAQINWLRPLFSPTKVPWEWNTAQLFNTSLETWTIFKAACGNISKHTEAISGTKVGRSFSYPCAHTHVHTHTYTHTHDAHICLGVHKCAMTTVLCSSSLELYSSHKSQTQCGDKYWNKGTSNTRPAHVVFLFTIHWEEAGALQHVQWALLPIDRPPQTATCKENSISSFRSLACDTKEYFRQRLAAAAIQFHYKRWYVPANVLLVF